MHTNLTYTQMELFFKYVSLESTWKYIYRYSNRNISVIDYVMSSVIAFNIVSHFEVLELETIHSVLYISH